MSVLSVSLRVGVCVYVGVCCIYVYDLSLYDCMCFMCKCQCLMSLMCIACLWLCVLCVHGVSFSGCVIYVYMMYLSLAV